MKQINQSSDNCKVLMKTEDIWHAFFPKSKSLMRIKQGQDCNLNCLHFITQIIRTYSVELHHRKLINFVSVLFSISPKTKSGNLKFSEYIWLCLSFLFRAPLWLKTDDIHIPHHTSITLIPILQTGLEFCTQIRST